MDSDNYVVIHGWMCNELNLKGNDLLVYAYIFSYSRDGQNKCYSNLDTIAKTFNISKPTVIKSIKNLVDSGYIIKHIHKDITKTNSYEHNVDVVKNLYSRSKESLPQRSKESLLNNNILISKDISNNKNDIDNKEIEWFLKNYHSICVSLPKVMKLSEKRKKAIRKILDNFSKDNILECFELAEQSDFLKGNNDRGWKADIDFILREDKFINIVEGKYGGRKKTRNTANSIEHLYEGLNERADKKGGNNGTAKF